MRKGKLVSLTKNNSALNKITFYFSWEVDGENLEIDVSAFLIDSTNKVSRDEDFIFYGNTDHESGSVKYIPEKSLMRVELKKIPAALKRISFALTIYDAETRGQNFSRVKVFVSAVDEESR